MPGSNRERLKKPCGKKNALAGELGKEVAAEVEQLLGKPAAEGLDFEAIEVAIRERVLRLAASAVERWLNTDVSDHTGAEIDCRCGGRAQYAGRRPKSFQTVLGELKLERAYYHCPQCGQGYCSRDRFLGMEETSLSPGLTRMVAAVGAAVSFEEGHQLLRELAGVAIDTKQVERSAEAVGADIAADERLDTQVQAPAPDTLYLGIDGTGIPMRPSELKGRCGKQADGLAKSREGKLCTIWSAESRDAEGNPVRDKGSVTYCAAIEAAATADTDKTVSDFTARVGREAARRDFFSAKRQVVIGDGANWIWNIAEELFPDAIQVLDRFHAKEHLSDVARVIYPDKATRAQQWTHRRYAELDSGRLDLLLRALQRQASRHEEARKCAQYIQNNRHRMRYAEFHAQGLCTSSGVVEAGCKVVVGHRLKRAGMHWTVRGANAIIALRCCRLSGRFEDFWERRSLRKAA